MKVERLDVEEWGRHLPSTGHEVFHAPEALSVLDEHAQGELRLYGGFKGDQAVGLLPLFVHSRPYGTTVTSPPPGLLVPRLGPVVMPTSPKRRKREKVNRSFVREVLSDVGADADSDLLAGVSAEPTRVTRLVEELGGDPRPNVYRILCGTEYTDPRPFVWDGFAVEPSFTYRVEVDDRDTEDLLSSFSKGLRREIRDAEELPVTVSVEGMDAARRVYHDLRARYDEQDEPFPADWAYVSDLVEALGDRCRVYVLRDEDGEFLAGITALYSGDAACFWMGGTRTTHEGVSVNSLLHWRIIRDIAEDPALADVTAYDLFGANTERLCRYKAKFNAELVPYYVAESGGVSLDLAKRVYQFTR